MRFTSIASGSSGNCTYVGSDNTHILIDAGVSKKKIEEGLNGLDLSLGECLDKRVCRGVQTTAAKGTEGYDGLTSEVVLLEQRLNR